MEKPKKRGPKPKYIYMRVTKDKYELPLAVADSLDEIARICGTGRANVWNNIARREKRGIRTKYVRVLAEGE